MYLVWLRSGCNVTYEVVDTSNRSVEHCLCISITDGSMHWEGSNVAGTEGGAVINATFDVRAAIANHCHVFDCSL